jgi:hypothetical protein
MGRVFVILAIALLALAPRAALADEAAARDAMARGTAALNAGNAEAALIEFRAAIAELPTAPVPYRYAGEALERLGRWAEAVASYQEYLRLRPEADDIRGRIERITQVHLTGRLTVRCDPPDATVAIDGTAAGQAPILERRLAIGDHTLDVAAPGRVARRLAVTVAPGASTLVECVLDRDPVPPSTAAPVLDLSAAPAVTRPAPRRQPWYRKKWVWAIAGAVVIGGTTAAILVPGADDPPDTAGGDIHFP